MEILTISISSSMLIQLYSSMLLLKRKVHSHAYSRTELSNFFKSITYPLSKTMTKAILASLQNSPFWEKPCFKFLNRYQQLPSLKRKKEVLFTSQFKSQRFTANTFLIATCKKQCLFLIIGRRDKLGGR